MAGSDRRLLRIVVVSLGLLFLCGASSQEGPEKEEEMARIRTLIEEGAWKQAARALKGYLRTYPGTPEEKAEVTGMLRHAEGSLKIEEIQGEYRRRHRIRKAVKKLDEFLEEYADFPDLVALARDVLGAVRSEYILVLQDFEGWKPEGEEEEEDEKNAKGPLQLETDPEFVKEGTKAGRWGRKRSGAVFSVPTPQKDFSGYDFVAMWIYSGKPEGRFTSHLRLEISSIDGGYYLTHIAIDWVGWRRIRLWTDSKKGVFSRRGRPDWKQIAGFHIYHSESVAHPVDIVLDDICLERKVD